MTNLTTEQLAEIAEAILNPPDGVFDEYELPKGWLRALAASWVRQQRIVGAAKEVCTVVRAGYLIEKFRVFNADAPGISDELRRQHSKLASAVEADINYLRAALEGEDE